jgi:hypothetical protein
MMLSVAFLSAEPSFTLAAFAVTWLAVVLLALIAGNLHVRLQRVEQAGAQARVTAAYGQLIGRNVGIAADGQPRLLLIMSSQCPTCQLILDEMAREGWTRRTALAWKNGRGRLPEAMPPTIEEIDDGARLIAELGIGVTPFALELDSNGFIISAHPVGSVEALKMEGAVVAP